MGRDIKLIFSFFFKGLYPESHGIVFNSFYAPDLKRRFSIRFSSYPAFWGGEPVCKSALFTILRYEPSLRNLSNLIKFKILAYDNDTVNLRLQEAIQVRNKNPNIMHRALGHSFLTTDLLYF